MTDTPHPFQTLTPEFIMDAVESRGFRCDCRTLALNSYENRVYQVGIEEGAPLIAKFYRPGRWSDEQIREEHEFCFELVGHELPVVAPWRDPAGESLFLHAGFRFALYPRQGGHAPEFDNLDNLLILGRMLARLHRVGAVRPFVYRPALDSQSFGHASVALIAERFIVPEEAKLEDRVETAVESARNAWIGIVDYAKRKNIDLITMNTYGGYKFRREDFIGSVAERVVQEAPCPVITVKPV